MIDWDQQVTPAMKDTLAAQAVREIEKRERQEQVDAILVTVASGNVYQGDEVSQSRLDRTINAFADNDPSNTVAWILADNTVATVPLTELAEALALAVAAQNAIWTTPAGAPS
jgi:hypothetical protein